MAQSDVLKVLGKPYNKSASLNQGIPTEKWIYQETTWDQGGWSWNRTVHDSAVTFQNGRVVGFGTEQEQHLNQNPFQQLPVQSNSNLSAPQTLTPIVPQPITNYPIRTFSNTIQSKIVDDFEELNEGTIMQLDNGQIWKQTSYDYEYHYGYRPDILIYRDGMRYKAKIEGFNRMPTVEQIK